MATANKVCFNLKNVYYATYVEVEGTYAFATPVAIPGAVSLSLSPEGETNKFYADGIAYYTAISNQGYSGTLEMARFPDKMMQDVWGMTLGTTSKVLTEKNNVEPEAFALLFQIDGDSDEELYVMYNCKGARPAITANTVEESKTPTTQSTDITCSPMSNNVVFARTTADTPSTTKADWFKEVFEES